MYADCSERAGQLHLIVKILFLDINRAFVTRNEINTNLHVQLTPPWLGVCS